MKIGVLTSSRADFGIYLPLLKKMKEDKFFHVTIIAFGTHLSHSHGYTINQILESGFKVNHRIESMVVGDSEEAISTAMALTSMKFSSFWAQHAKDFDIVFCLGDRYEMFAAVSASIPFNIKLAHLHGGEKTLGAIDNVFRHSISHVSKYHFCSTEQYAQQLKKMLDEPKHIYNVGALSLDNLERTPLYSIEEFQNKWNIDLSQPTILVTFHPETVDNTSNEKYATILSDVLKNKKNFQIIITMPNADTSGSIIRKIFTDSLGNQSHVKLIENFGTKGYFTCMKYCYFLLGNTSSGIIEAASFGKYVIDLGDRQKGRVAGENVLHCKIGKNEIEKAIQQIKKAKKLSNENIYWNGGAADKIVYGLQNCL